MPKAKGILFEVYSLFYQFSWYSKLLGFKIIVNFNDIFLKSYHDFLVEFMTCLYVRTFFPILYMYMCVCFIKKKKKKNLMTFFVMSYCLLFDPHLSLYGHHGRSLYKKKIKNKKKSRK